MQILLTNHLMLLHIIMLTGHFVRNICYSLPLISSFIENTYFINQLYTVAVTGLDLPH